MEGRKVGDGVGRGLFEKGAGEWFWLFLRGVGSSVLGDHQ